METNVPVIICGPNEITTNTTPNAEVIARTSLLLVPTSISLAFTFPINPRSNNNMPNTSSAT